MSGRLVPSFLQGPLKKQFQVESWKAAPLVARSFASNGDGPSKKYDIVSKPEEQQPLSKDKEKPSPPAPTATDVGKLPSTNPPPSPTKPSVKESATVVPPEPSSKTTLSGGAPPGTPSTGPRPGTSSPPPPPGTPSKPPSGNGLAYGFALLGLAGAGGFVWYTWEDGGPWGLWGPDLYPGKKLPEPSKGGVEDVATVARKGLEVNKGQKEGDDGRGEGTEGPKGSDAKGQTKGEDGGGVTQTELKGKKGGHEEAAAALAAVGAEVASSAAEVSAEVEDVEDSFDSFAQAAEAARKATLAAEVAALKADAPQDTPLPESDDAPNADDSAEVAESDSPDSEEEDVGESILKDRASLPKLLAAVGHEARTAQMEEDRARFETKIKEAHAKAIREAELRNQLEKVLRKEREGFAKALKTQAAEAEKRRTLALQAQEKGLREAGEALSAARVAEDRARRLADLEDINQKLLALEEAFDDRSKDARKSYHTHKLALAAFALETDIRNGSPLRASADALHQLLAEEGASDPLLETALAALPTDAISKGLATRTQLQHQFLSIKAQMKELSLVPASQGGLISRGLAKVVALLKVSESGSQLPGGGSDAAIARAEALLADGDLPGAAAALREGLKGSQAEVAVSGWTRAALQTAEVEQSLLLIQAYAASQAASLR